LSPSTNLIRDKVEYEAWKERDNSNNYILKNKTSAQDDFHEHWKRRCLVAAEEAYKQTLEDKEEKRLLEEQERKRERLEERRLKLKARQLMNQKAAGLRMEGSEENSHIRLHREVNALKDQLKQQQEGGQDGTDNDQPKEEEEEEKEEERKGRKDKDEGDEEDSDPGEGGEQHGRQSQSQLLFPTRKRGRQGAQQGKRGKGALDFLCCFGKKDAAKKTAPASEFFDIFDDEPGDKGEGEKEGGDVVGDLPPAEEDFAAKMKRVAKARRQSRRASRVVPFAQPTAQEPVEEPPGEGKKKPKYPRKSANKRRRKATRKNSTEVVQSQDQAAPDDKRWHRKQAKLKRRAELDALKKKQQEDEERMLAELQKETRLQKALVVGKGFLRVLCCCFVKSNKKNKFADKFTIKSDAELESEKMQRWMTSKRDVLMVETMFTVRSIERESKRRYRAFFRWFGSDVGRELEQSADNLRASSLNGRYKEVLDTLEDDDFNANTVNSLGDTAFYAVVNRALDGSGGEVDHDDDDNTVTIGCWAHVKKKVGSLFKKKSPKGRLDLILKILTVRGGDVNFVRVTKDKFEDGHALVHEAAKGNREGMLEWLVSKDVNVNILTSRFRKTPLMLAAEAGHGEMVRTLLHRGSIDTIHHADNRGWTALHYAAAYCESQFVKMLLVCGAEMGVRTEANRLPLEEAQSRGRMENVAALMFHKDRSRMFTHRILYYDQEGTRQQVAAQQEAARHQEASGPLGLAGLRKLGNAS